MAAFMPDPHILLMVVQPTLSGMPAPRLAWRAGAWPWPACSTLPTITSSTSAGFIRPRLEGGLDGPGAELGGGQGGKLAQQSAHGRAGGGRDDDGIRRAHIDLLGNLLGRPCQAAAPRPRSRATPVAPHNRGNAASTMIQTSVTVS